MEDFSADVHLLSCRGNDGIQQRRAIPTTWIVRERATLALRRGPQPACRKAGGATLRVLRRDFAVPTAGFSAKDCDTYVQGKCSCATEIACQAGRFSCRASRGEAILLDGRKNTWYCSDSDRLTLNSTGVLKYVVSHPGGL